MSDDLLAARVCRAAAVAVFVSGAWLVTAHQLLAAVLVLWLAPSLLVVAGQARRAHRAHVEMERAMDAWLESAEGQA